jgi:hypothetical protein
VARNKKENPIPADLLAMNREQLEQEEARHDSGDIRARREELIIQRDNAQTAIEELSIRRFDISRAIVQLLSVQNQKRGA